MIPFFVVPPKYSPYWTNKHFNFLFWKKSSLAVKKKITFLKFLSNGHINILKCKLHILSIPSQKKTLAYYWWKRIRQLLKIKNPKVFKKSKCKMEQEFLEFRTLIYWQNRFMYFIFQYSKRWRKIPNN